MKLNMCISSWCMGRGKWSSPHFETIVFIYCKFVLCWDGCVHLNYARDRVFRNKAPLSKKKVAGCTVNIFHRMVVLLPGSFPGRDISMCIRWTISAQISAAIGFSNEPHVTRQTCSSVRFLQWLVSCGLSLSVQYRNHKCLAVYCPLIRTSSLDRWF
jgi:hypothetical protein